MDKRQKVENEKSQVNAKNVLFSLDTAKHICIMSDTESSYKIREYLINIEKEFRKMISM